MILLAAAALTFLTPAPAVVEQRATHTRVLAEHWLGCNKIGAGTFYMTVGGMGEIELAADARAVGSSCEPPVEYQDEKQRAYRRGFQSINTATNRQPSVQPIIPARK